LRECAAYGDVAANQLCVISKFTIIA